MRKVADVFNAGYSLEEMKAMAEVIPNSHKILNDAIGFRMEIPKEFEKNEGDPHRENVIYSYIQVREDGEVFAINIERLGGYIRYEPTQHKDMAIIKEILPPGGTAETFEALWQDYILDGYTTTFSLDDVSFTSHSVQVPLAREAIQINVAASSMYHQESKVLLRTLLQSLKGISNWRVFQEDRSRSQ